MTDISCLRSVPRHTQDRRVNKSFDITLAIAATTTLRNRTHPAMELLDLSTEIFECVMAHYVNGEGIRRAWLRRSVCSNRLCHYS